MSMYDRLLQRMNPDNNEWSPEKIVTLTISLILAILAVVFIWPKIDRVPATNEDYKSLYNYLETIQGKPEEFFNKEGNISVKEDAIHYEIENDECKMTGVYNKDFQLITTLEEDKATATYKLVLGLAVLFFLIFFVCLFSIFIAIGVIEIFIIAIILQIKRRSKQ